MKSAPMILVLWAVSGLAVVGCDTSDRVGKNPVGVVRDRKESARVRTMAVDYITEHRSDPGAARINPQAAYKEIAWSASEPPKVRAAVVGALLNDPDPAVVADAKEMAKMLLPREGSREVVVVICQNAGEKGWKDFLPSLVRSYSRPVEGTPDEERAERKAIQALGDGKSVEEVAFEVFLHPPKIEPMGVMDWTMRCRTDAWDLLARLDKTGDVRLRLLAAAEAGNGDALLEAIRVCRRDLRAIPMTGDELVWLSSLRREDHKEDAAWWREATAAVARVPASAGELRLRYIEPIRWAAANKPEWLTATREELLSELALRLQHRESHRRQVKDGKNSGPTKGESLEQRRDELTWGDALSILVIDDAVRQPQIVAALMSQTDADRADTSTEYGGLLAFKRSAAGEHAVAMLYPPRPAQRLGDDRFVASDDMISGGDQALAHYHFHVQREKNADYAGPSAGDVEYAARYGRSCLVFTSMRQGVLGVDYYQPDGVVIDLGVIGLGVIGK